MVTALEQSSPRRSLVRSAIVNQSVCAAASSVESCSTGVCVVLKTARPPPRHEPTRGPTTSQESTFTRRCGWWWWPIWPPSTGKRGFSGGVLAPPPESWRAWRRGSNTIRCRKSSWSPPRSIESRYGWRWNGIFGCTWRSSIQPGSRRPQIRLPRCRAAGAPSGGRRAVLKLRATAGTAPVAHTHPWPSARCASAAGSITRSKRCWKKAASNFPASSPTCWGSAAGAFSPRWLCRYNSAPSFPAPRTDDFRVSGQHRGSLQTPLNTQISGRFL